MIDLTNTNGLQIDLASTGAEFTTTGLNLPDDLPEAEWAKIGQKLVRGNQVIQWWIGDWAQFGAGNPSANGWRKKGALIEFCRLNGFNYNTLRGYSWVSGSIHLCLRRSNLEYSFFKEVADLSPKEQRKWLNRATEGDLSVADLRREIRVSNGEQNALVSEGPTLEFGTKYFDDLKGWLLVRPESFWIPERQELWKNRILELVSIVTDQVKR